ncbi:MAG: 1-(5-phosphoribosyl)-5-[(5-phosphoribosylamino)methylideneamino]imidazole-4-carboxamide isomerase [Anaerolineales bacterium]|nr:MAG: 1-(5-phosphoribosyl)-5-[(5-phosphoribosylamino)methylideneamino]imidazole-4-carboxamide isomerase [Anaerolineales bacterium]
MDSFTIYPAIDLRHGRVVRLSQGDPDRETSYANRPRIVAQKWQQSGAHWLHVVNLDGAFGEQGAENITALADITATGLRVQFGGGLRNMETLRRALDLGVERVVLGTVAVHNPAFVIEALAEFGPGRIVMGIDARDGVVQVRGWQEATQLEAVDLALQWADMGGTWLVFTDISRDGMGSGVNVSATAALANATGLKVIASGGVGSLVDVQRVMQAGLEGVIIGRALYEGGVDLEQALALAGS